MIGLISIWQHEPLITLVEYMSLKELVAIVHGIKISRSYDGNIMTNNLLLIITLLMIYLVNADQLLNNNTMIKLSLVHNEWSTR